MLKFAKAIRPVRETGRVFFYPLSPLKTRKNLEIRF